MASRIISNGTIISVHRIECYPRDQQFVLLSRRHIQGINVSALLGPVFKIERVASDRLSIKKTREY